MEKHYVSVPLSILLHDLLGHNHYVPISRQTAESILLHTGNKHTCYIQFPSDQDVDILGRIITTPILWDLNAWRASCERREKSKIRAQIERDERFVLEGNIRLVKNAIIKLTSLSPEIAHTIARITLDKKDYIRIKAFGVKRLYSNVKELP